MGALSVKDRIAAKRGQIAAGKSKGIRPYKFKTGKTLFRILPSPDASKEFFRDFGKMWLKSFDGQQKFSIGDRDITFGETDPIKEMIFSAMRAAPNEETRDHYKGMLAQRKNIFCALIISVNGQPDPEQSPTEPVIIEVSETQFDNILAQFETYADVDPDHDLASADRGHIFSCEKSGSGFDTKYTFLATPKQAAIKKEIVDKAIDLDAWIQGEFEGLENKAIEFLGRLNGAAGITVQVPVGLLQQGTNGAAPQASLPAPAAAPQSNVSAAAVTTQIDEDDGITDAEIEPVADSPFEDNAAPAAEPTPVPAAAATPAAAAPAESNEIDDILAGLQ
jgi:hypothetical protein